MIGLQNHQVTAYRFLRLLEAALNRQKYSKAKTNDAKSSPFVSFAYNLSFALECVVNSSTMHMDKITDLYPMSSYAKLLSAYRNIAREIYNLLPRKSNPELFLGVGHPPDLSCERYFGMSFPDKNEPDQYPEIFSISIPSPYFFDIGKSYLYLLHEIAHFQAGSGEYNKKGVSFSLKNAAFRDIVLARLARMVVDSASNKQWRYSLDEAFEVMSNFKEIKALNDENSMEEPRKGFSQYIPDLLLALERAKKRLANSLNPSYNGISGIIGDFLNYSDFLTSLEYAFDEARADILMIQMADKNFGLKDYFEDWDEYFKRYGIDPHSATSSFAFALQCTFVFEYFINNEQPIDAGLKGQLPWTAKLFEIHSEYNWLAFPFVQYVKSWRFTDLHKSLCERWQNYSSASGKSPRKFALQEQLEFYINHWFEDLKLTLGHIKKMADDWRNNVSSQ